MKKVLFVLLFLQQHHKIHHQYISLLTAHMVLSEDKYALISLNLPRIEESKLQIHDALFNNLFSHYTKFGQGEHSKKYKSIFQGFENINGIKEPIPDPNRFHCEELLDVFKYRPLKTPLAKQLTNAPTKTKKLLQYVMKGAGDIAKMIGGADMKVIYSSLLVSLPGGGNQAFHEDVHEELAKEKKVYAMIISLADSTRVDVDIGKGKERSVAIPAGYAMIFDAKNLTHRGVGYNEVNLRIYLKFAVDELSETGSGESEVVPQEVCLGCNKRISVKSKTHGEKCEKYHEIVLKYANAEAKQRVACNKQNNARKNKTRDKKRKSEVVCPGCNKRISVQLETHIKKCEKYHENILKYTNAEAKQRVAWFKQDNVRKNTNRNKMRKIEGQMIKGEKTKKGSIIREIGKIKKTEFVEV